MPLTLGYKASAEQFGPRELLDYSVLAEQLGLDSIAVSDHFQPWRHHGGHSPGALTWLGALGERTERALLGTSVLTPTMRYQPAIVAQSFATLACLNPGRHEHEGVIARIEELLGILDLLLAELLLEHDAPGAWGRAAGAFEAGDEAHAADLNRHGVADFGDIADRHHVEIAFAFRFLGGLSACLRIEAPDHPE